MPQLHRIRTEIMDEFTRTSALHIKKGDLTGYTADENFIYKILSEEEYHKAIVDGGNEPFKMKELGLNASYDFNFKGGVDLG